MAFRNNRRPTTPRGSRRSSSDGQSFLTILRRFTSSVIVERGDRYAGAGLVSIVRGGVRAAIGSVQGTNLYATTIRFGDDGISVSCTCPHYVDQQTVCKHIWATAVVATTQGKLAGGPVKARIIFRDADEQSAVMPHDEDTGDEEYDEDAGDDVVEVPAPAPLPRRRREGRPGREDEPTIVAGLNDVVTLTPDTPPRGTVPWRRGLEQVSSRAQLASGHRWSLARRQLIFVVDLQMSRSERALEVIIFGRDRISDGEWGRLSETALSVEDVEHVPDAVDRTILVSLLGAADADRTEVYPSWRNSRPKRSRFRLFAAAAAALLPAIGETERLYIRKDRHDFVFNRAFVDTGRTLSTRLVVTESVSPPGHTMRLELVDSNGVALETPPRLVIPGLALIEQTFVAAELPPDEWREMLDAQPLWVADGEAEALVESLLAMRSRPQLALPEALRYQEITVAPRPMLKLTTAGAPTSAVSATLTVEYEDRSIEIGDTRPGIYDSVRRLLFVRDAAAESALIARLTEAGFRRVTHRGDFSTFQIASRRMPPIVRELVAEGWHVEAEGKIYRQPGEAHVRVSTGIDWFEVHGTVEFGEQVVGLPQLLAALRRGDGSVVLGDGTFGLLPEQWLRRYAHLIGLGETHGDHVRMRRSQVGLIDALVAAMPDVTIDERAAAARAQLAEFSGVVAADPPASFTGTLREYQREGLGWTLALERLGFGGCLADDMGLGKTVVALALLETRRVQREEQQRVVEGGGEPPADTIRRTSLIVVPKSLMFNWRQEAERFAPRLRLIDHIGVTRLKSVDVLADYDIVLTTYGTLRQDVMLLKDVAFDYVILDEAQAIKNAASISAKSVRLLNASHRLALSGTPVENHLGELWSLFEFLNPGMLGAAAAFERFAAAGGDVTAREGLRRALRPFILRRTKDQVARDLPEKLEQTLECELGPTQRKQYDELRRYYRANVLGTIEKQGMARSKLQVLEALLRLRQAACHPALLDPKKRASTSAKFDVLIPMLEDVIDAGSKALVFSQFTSLLALLRAELDRREIAYEYLDGRTRDRQARVERFQNDPALPLFLISLKAGGVGLNLTAAEYVFLLDPWWNPAVEAQAIDRTHRIGQERRVFAYRVIATDTIEERVIELQSSKRDLADAIITEDNSLVRGLQKEDFELLLS